LLLKLSDRDEDVRGTAVHLWSGNVGLHRNPARRPRLELDWSSPTPQATAEYAVHLEHGRTAELPALKAPNISRYIVSFQPEELGRWRYWYEHDLDEGFRGADGVFDVVPGDRQAIAQQLQALAQRIRDRNYEDPKLAVHKFGPEFWALERAALASMTPEEWAGEPGREMDQRIVEVRKLMDTRELPDKQRMRPAKIGWQEEQKEAKP
jgi:hypothetical protein